MTEITPALLAAEFNTSERDVRSTLTFLFGALPEGVSRWELSEEQATYYRTYAYGMGNNSGYYGGPGSSAEEPDEYGLKRLTIRDWRQFDRVDMDLSNQLTVITGENGTGKTSLLQLLGQTFEQGAEFVGTPTRDKEGFFFKHGRRRPIDSGEIDKIGTITFASGASAHVGIRQWQHQDQPSFAPDIVPYRRVAGMYLDAQRLIGPYQRVESIPPRFNSASEIARLYREQIKNLWNPHMVVKSPSLLIKEALIAAALYGEGSAVLQRDPRAAKVWNGFQAILEKLFPESLGFKGLRIDQGEVILRSSSGPFALEASSGGIAAILSLAWQIYLTSFESAGRFTVCFDEPENHLHPSLQRSILPSLLEAFPSVHFVVATHSPFVVTSTRAASVYALRRQKNGKVYTEKLDLERQAFSADEILNDVLGVGTTIPIWAERSLETIIDDFQDQPKDSASMEKLLARLRAAGLRLTMPSVTGAVAENLVDSSNGTDEA